jgi:hypothetical protein
MQRLIRFKSITNQITNESAVQEINPGYTAEGIGEEGSPFSHALCSWPPGRHGSPASAHPAPLPAAGARSCSGGRPAPLPATGARSCGGCRISRRSSIRSSAGVSTVLEVLGRRRRQCWGIQENTSPSKRRSLTAFSKYVFQEQGIRESRKSGTCEVSSSRMCRVRETWFGEETEA